MDSECIHTYTHRYQHVNDINLSISFCSFTQVQRRIKPQINLYIHTAQISCVLVDLVHDDYGCSRASVRRSNLLKNGLTHVSRA